MAELTDCACGQDHEVMPTDEDGTELVCRIHRRHIPCRRCRLDTVAHITERSSGYADDPF